MKRINCRVHGGTFEIVPKRGRPPVKCADDNMCTKHPDVKVIAEGPVRTRRSHKPEPVAAAFARARKADPLPQTLTRRTRPVLPTADEVRNVSAKEAAAMVKPAQPPVEPSTQVPASVAKALEAKALLEAQGWTCHAKRAEGGGVEFHASRGTERITMAIASNGHVISQNYSLWDTQKPDTNGVPRDKVRLDFNPDELSDSQLVSLLRERTVIWWNRIGGFEEKATLPHKVQITHTFNGHDDEVPGDRVITFVDLHGGGFRSFRQGALMRLDK